MIRSTRSTCSWLPPTSWPCTDGHLRWDFARYVTVLDVIRNLRDEAIRNKIGASKGKPWSKLVQAHALREDGRPTTIEVPSIAGQPAKSLEVAMDITPRSVLRMAVSEENVTWLANVVNAERAEAIAKHVAPTNDDVTELRKLRDELDINNVWIERTGRVRAVRPDTNQDDDQAQGSKKATMVCHARQSSASAFA